MRREVTAWSVVSIAGITSGVVAGAQQRVTTPLLLVISGILAVATVIASSILPRDADSVP